MAKPIGPTFGDELAAAGLAGLPFAWTANGTFSFGVAMTGGQIAAVTAVYAAHDPAKPAPPPPPEPRAWLERLPADKQAAIMAAALANATVLLWVMKASGSVNIDVNDQEAKDGVAALVAAGVLTKDDAAVLLAP